MTGVNLPIDGITPLIPGAADGIELTSGLIIEIGFRGKFVSGFKIEIGEGEDVMDLGIVTKFVTGLIMEIGLPLSPVVEGGFKMDMGPLDKIAVGFNDSGITFMILSTTGILGGLLIVIGALLFNDDNELSDTPVTPSHWESKQDVCLQQLLLHCDVIVLTPLKHLLRLSVIVDGNLAHSFRQVNFTSKTNSAAHLAHFPPCTNSGLLNLSVHSFCLTLS